MKHPGNRSKVLTVNFSEEVDAINAYNDAFFAAHGAEHTRVHRHGTHVQIIDLARCVDYWGEWLLTRTGVRTNSLAISDY